MVRPAALSLQGVSTREHVGDEDEAQEGSEHDVGLPALDGQIGADQFILRFAYLIYFK